MSAASNKVRIEWKANDAKRDAGLTTPEDIQRFDNIQYGEDPVWNCLDVYRPKNQTGRLPVIISVHGGGWVYGDKNLYQFYGMTLAQRNFNVINFSYRLAPENKFPVQIEDINNVVKWMYRNEDQYKFDLKHVFMVGDSAGAHLASLYTNICTNKIYAKNYQITVPNNFIPTALGLNCGAYSPLSKDTENEESNTGELMEDFLPDKGTKEEIDLIDVTKHITSDFPPVYLMTAVGDFCTDHTLKMDRALTKNNVKHILKIYGSNEKPLYHVFHVTIQEEEGQKCNDDECEFFKSYC